MNRRTSRILAGLAAASLVAAACSRGPEEGEEAPDATATGATGAPAGTEPSAETEPAEETTPGEETTPEETTPVATDAPTETTTGGTEAGATTAPDDGGEAWTVNTDDCVDPDRANEPIEGTIRIGASMPLSGGVAAAAFGPVAEGFKAYVDYANAQGLVPDHELELTIGDDQYDPSLTPNVVNGLLDDGVHLFSGIIGTPNNAAVRDVLNEECVPQLLALTGSPAWGEVADYPWTTGANNPYDLESAAYAQQIAEDFPDGATVALFTVANDFGEIYKEAFEEQAAELGFEIVDQQTIEAADSAPPAAQLSSIAGSQPDVIMAVPLGAQCPTFMTELANAKAVEAGWEPRVYITNTCASPLILAVAGASADGLYTSAVYGLVDINNPEVQASNTAAQTFIQVMTERDQADLIPTAGAGWNTGEVTVEILRQAAEAPEGLTQASIINVSRNLTYVPSLAREGVEWKMSGEEDPFYAEDFQIVQYDATAGLFNDVGELNTSFRSS